MTTLLIEKDDGTEQELTILDGSITNQYREQSHADVEVIRSEWREVEGDIDDIDDEFFILEGGSKEFGGRLVDTTNKSDHVLVEIGSFEEDALDAQPTDSTLKFVGVPDSDVVEDAISRIPELSVGTIDTLDTDVSVLFSNSSPAGMIREMQKTSRALVRYNADKTVDYLERPSTITARVGPDESNVEDTFDVTANERDEFTHVRVLGSQEGEARIQAEAVVDSYDGGRQSWRKYPDKSITSESRAQKIADEIVAEAEEEEDRRIRVETVVFGEQFSVGDRVETVSVQDSLDQVLRVIKKTDRLEGATTVSKLELSSRIIIDESDEQKQRRDVERFNQGFQGDVVTINSGGYRAPVDSGFRYVFSVRKPDDVVKELTAEIEIDALPYRFYSEPIDHTHDLSIPFSNLDHSHSVDIPFSNVNHSHNLDMDGHSHDLSMNGHSHSVDIPVPTHNHPISFESIGTSLESDDDGNFFHNHQAWQPQGFDQLLSDSGGDTQLHFTNFEVSDSETTTETTDSVADGGTAVNEATGGTTVTEFFDDVVESSDQAFFDDVVQTSEASSGVDPGIVETDSFPSNCDVIVNGQSVGVSLGDGSSSFSEVVDISGFLTEGFNTIEITSDALGHIRATAFLDLYRQITQ